MDQEIKDHLTSPEAGVGLVGTVLEHIDADRLLAAPDCGLMMLGRDLAMAKLKNMCAAAQAI